MVEPIKQLMAKRLDPVTSLILAAPVFLVYHLGVLVIHYRNGVDWVTNLTFELVEWSKPAYVAVTIALVVALALYGYLRDKDKALQRPLFTPVVLESAVWAVVMLFSVGWVTAKIQAELLNTSVWPPVPQDMGVTAKIVMAAGAGFHEELVFRMLLLGGGYRLLKMRIKSPAFALLLASLFSAVLFALAHHVGAVGDPFTIGGFAFRTMAGLFLGLLHVVRGFAVAVYTHTVYDILVFFFL